MRTNLLSLFLCLSFVTTFAQKLPQSNVMLMQIDRYSDSISVSKPMYLTQFNKFGYNNQPYFMTDDELYMSVQFPYDTTQTDIYSLNLATKEFTQITETKESEYSPKLSPDGAGFTVVRVDANKEKAQRLWQYPLDRSGKGNALLSNTDIGYYQFVTPKKVVAFIVEPQEKHHMSTIELGSGNESKFSMPIGRCFQNFGNGTIAYVDKSIEDAYQLMRYTPADYTFGLLVDLPVGANEDFVFLDENIVLLAQGSRLYSYNLKTKSGWKLAIDLKSLNIKKIERLALNKKGQLAMVIK